MATITSVGLGSGLDVNKILTQLRAIEERPLTLMKSKAALVETKISAYGQVQSLFSSLSDAAAKLAQSSTWSARTVNSSNSAAVSASTASGAAVTSFSVEVSQLAQSQVSASTVVPADKSLGAGTLTLQLGRWSDDGAAPFGKSFAASGAAAVEIKIDAGSSLSGVAAQINQARAGVSATVVAGIGGPQLLLKSSSTGEEMGFQMTAAPDPDHVLQADEVGVDTLALDQGAASMKYATDAHAAINGIAVQSASNTLSGAVEGVTLTLGQKTVAGAPVEISVSNDTAAMQKAVEGFVSAYNATNQMISNLTSFDSEADPGRGGALLQGDATVLALQNQMRRLVGGAAGDAGMFGHLSDLGIGVPKSVGGKVISTNLEIDSVKLKAALTADPVKVASLFTTDTGNTDTEGVALKFRRMASAVLGSGGAFASKSEALTTQKTSLTKEQERVAVRVDAWEARLRKQYTALDTTMSKLNSLNSYISQQVEQWNKPSR